MDGLIPTSGIRSDVHTMPRRLPLYTPARIAHWAWQAQHAHAEVKTSWYSNLHPPHPPAPPTLAKASSAKRGWPTRR